MFGRDLELRIDFQQSVVENLSKNVEHQDFKKHKVEPPLRPHEYENFIWRSWFCHYYFKTFPHRDKPSSCSLVEMQRFSWILFGYLIEKCFVDTTRNFFRKISNIFEKGENLISLQFMSDITRLAHVFGIFLNQPSDSMAVFLYLQYLTATILENLQGKNFFLKSQQKTRWGIANFKSNWYVKIIWKGSCLTRCKQIVWLANKSVFTEWDL